MTPSETLKFFKDVDAATVARSKTGTTYLVSGKEAYEYELDAATQWVTMAKTALESVLPRGHAVIRQFEGVFQAHSEDVTEENTFEGLRAVFRAATKMLEVGQLSSLAEGIRADTESELLGQAEYLLNESYLVAAAVLAGGALETHLHGLCIKHSLTWPGSGSISKYDAAIAQVRNQGNEIYSATDSKNVTAWGGLRNDAAHDPTAFRASAERVQLMIEGIREFIART